MLEKPNCTTSGGLYAHRVERNEMFDEIRLHKAAARWNDKLLNLPFTDMPAAVHGQHDASNET